MCLSFLTVLKALLVMRQYGGCGTVGMLSASAFEMVREGNLAGTPSEGLLIPPLPGSTQSGQAGDLICIMRVTHRTYLGAFMTHCGGLSSIVPAGHPLKCLLTCWALERVAPDSQTRSN